MTNATPGDTKYASEQDEWDRKSQRVSNAVVAVIALFTVAILGSLTWAIFAYASPATGILLDADTHSMAEIEKAEKDLKKAQHIILSVIGSLVVLYLPLKIAIRYTKFKIGRRPPKGGWIDRPAQPLTVSIEKVSDNLRLFRVVSLRNSDEEYLFEVQRIVHEPKARKPGYSFFISESNDKIWVRSTIESGSLIGLTEDEVTKYITDQISYILESKADYFESADSTISSAVPPSH